MVIPHSFAFFRPKCDLRSVYWPVPLWYVKSMGGSIACERHWSQRDYDDDLVKRAKATMAVLERAPEEPDDPELDRFETIVMDRVECYDLLKRAVAALEFFCPHFYVFDEVMHRARDDWSFRCKDFFSRLVRWNWADREPGSSRKKHERMISVYNQLLGQVSATSKNSIDIETRIVRVARGWINWHDLERGRTHSQGAYR